MLLCFTTLASLGSLLRILTYLDPFPFFLEMHGLGDFHAPLDSVEVISLVESISRALSYAASRLLLEVLFCWGPGISGSLPTPFVVLLFCPGFSGTAFCSFKVPGSSFSVFHSHPLLLFFCLGCSVNAFGSLGSPLLWVPTPCCVLLCYTVRASLGQPFAGRGTS